MNRSFLIVLGVTTIFLVGLIGYRSITRYPSGQSKDMVNSATKIADSFATISTRAFSLQEFEEIVRDRSRTNLSGLTNDEQAKLLDCISRFYACYSSGNYDAFKRLRWHPPLKLSVALVNAARKSAQLEGMRLESDEEILRYAWHNYNGTNKVGQVDPDKIKLTIIASRDLGTDLRAPSDLEKTQFAPMCWEGAVLYEPSPEDLLKQHGDIRFFKFEVAVRFNHLFDGPASPLVFLGYWDTTRSDWMPYALCTMFRAGSFDTIF